MASKKTNDRPNVVSFRVSDEELRVLRSLWYRKHRKKPLATMIREMMLDAAWEAS